MSPKHTSPGPFPSANPITSYWRNNTKSIDEHRSTEYLPSKADIVIVGAGYSGASIAYHLVQESERYGRPIPSIVILEAREACSGATGRNGMFLTLFVRIDPD
jgi:ribulose 1,5-bisphosphate synthetase/thiazole synthase